MEAPLILTFDLGTQSTRCLLVRPDGGFEDLCQVRHNPAYHSAQPGWAEQRPDFYYERICEAGRTVCARNPQALRRVSAVALTTIRDTVLCLDAENRPLRDCILWLDSRQAAFDAEFPLSRRLIFGIAGMSGTAETIYRASACNWIAQHEPDLWAKTAQYVMLPTYLNYKLTGVLADTPRQHDRPYALRLQAPPLAGPRRPHPLHLQHPAAKAVQAGAHRRGDRPHHRGLCGRLRRARGAAPHRHRLG